MSRRRRAFVAAGLAVAVLLAIVLARHAIVGFLLPRVLSVATGYDVRFGAHRLGREHGALIDVHVSKGGEPVLDAARIDVTYALRDVFPGGAHRFGFASLALTRPVFSLVRLAAGGYNVTGGGSAAPPRPTRSAAAPYFFTVRVRGGTIRLIDRAPVQRDLAEQDVVDVAIDASVKSDARSTVRLRGALLGAPAAGAPLARYPFALASTTDDERAYTDTRLRAVRLPLRGPLGLLLHSRAVHFDDGTLADVDLRAYALGSPARDLPALRYGGRARLAGARITVPGLAVPVRALNGELAVVDDQLFSPALAGRLGALAVAARGGVFDLGHPQFRLAVRGAGDLRDLRALFAFSRALPVTGRATVETVLEAPVAAPLIRTAVRVAGGAYGRVPFSAAGGIVDYHAGTVVLSGFRGRYGPATLGIGGRFLLDDGATRSAIVVSAAGPGAALPYAQNVAPEAAVRAVALITGERGYRARGAIVADGPGERGGGFFDVDERGVGEFGPFAFARRDGSSLVGALRLDRTTSSSAGWISARDYRIAAPAPAADGARLPGITVPAFPPLGGVLDGAFAGGGTPDRFALSGEADGRELRVAGYAVGRAHATVGGTLRDVRLGALRIDGPLGHFRGAADAADGVFALRGDYDGSLEALAPLTRERQATGAVHGPLAATIGAGVIVVQSSGAAIAGGRVRGIAVERAAGTIAVGAHVRVIAASAALGGVPVVAGDAGGRIAVSAAGIPTAALRGTGVPLDAGRVSVFGLADLRGPATRFDGTFTVAGARAGGYPVAGDARIALAGPHLFVSAGDGAIGSTFGTFGGTLEGVGARTLRYDMYGDVALGDIATVRRTLAVPVRYLEGSFSARLRVRGGGDRPEVSGPIDAPEGSVNGLAFRDARADLRLAAGSVAVRAGTVTVGSTRTAVAAALSAAGFSLALRSRAATLADFNDYFDAGDTLAGTGSFDVAFANDGTRTSTRGEVELTDLRYGRLPFGRTEARWLMNGAAVQARAAVGGPAGSLSGTATIRPAPGGAAPAFAHARYDGAAQIAGLQLDAWLPALGQAAPLRGAVDGQLAFAGRLPGLALTGAATLRNGFVAGFPVKSASLEAAAAGTRVTLRRADADLGFAQLEAAGSFGFGPGDPLALDVRAVSTDAGRALHELAPVSRAIDVGGAVTSDVRVGGTLAAPHADGGFDLTNARFRTFVIPRAIGAVTYDGHAFALRDTEVLFTKGQAFVAGSLPLQTQPFAIGPAHAPLSFDVTARAVDLAQFAPLFPSGTTLGGIVDGRFGVEGDVAQPRLLGSLSLTDGSYTSGFERAPIRKVGATLRFEGTSVAVDAFHAGVGRGTLDGSGRFELGIATGTATGYAIDVRAQKAQLDFPAFGRGTVDGTIRIASEPARPLVTGDLALSDAVIPFAALYRTGGGGGDGGAAQVFDPAFNIVATAGKDVRVHSSIIDIGATGKVDLRGTFAQPTLAGTFRSTGGSFSTYNHSFRVERATVAFDPADGVVPTIDLVALTHVTNPDPDPTRNIAGSADITVAVQGPADGFTTKLTSDPPYSDAQIAGLLLDIPAILGAVNFRTGPGGTLLGGAPGESNVLLPPGVSPEQTGTITLNQEVFSLLSGQLTQRALSPIESVFAKAFGFSDLSFTVDYGGGIGYSLRRRLGAHDLFAVVSQTLSYPERTNVGFEQHPNDVTSLNFVYFRANGVTSLITTNTPNYANYLSRRETSLQPLGDREGFSLTLTKRYP